MSRKRRHKKRRTDEAEAETEAKAEAETGTVEVAAPVGENIEDTIQREHESSSDASSDPAEATKELEPEDARGRDDEELERLAAEAREMRALAQRRQAEFENFRRRIERERAEFVEYAAADVLKEILPVLDNLERAMEAAKSATSEGEGQLREGVEIICRQFRDTLNKLGLTEVEAEDVPFDPHVHEAVGRVETDEHPEGTVVKVLQKGYLFKDRLLRPSMVGVSLPTGGGSSEEDHESEDEAVRHGE